MKINKTGGEKYNVLGLSHEQISALCEAYEMFMFETRMSPPTDDLLFNKTQEFLKQEKK